MRGRRIASIVAMLIGVLVAACSSPGASSAPTSAPSASASSSGGALSASAASDKPYDGTTITVLAPDNKAFTWYGTQVAPFTEATGITVNYQNIPEASYADQLTVKLTAKDPSFDAFFNNARASHGLQALGGLAPLDDLIANPQLTPKSFDYDGIPAAAQDICRIDGKVYCLNIHGGSVILFANKDLLTAAGVTAMPQTTDELMEAAMKVKATGNAGFCMRAIKDLNVYPFTDLWSRFSPWTDNTKGTWFDSAWKPQVNAEGTVKAATFWHDILTKAGPNGIASYNYTECLADFQQGKLGLWLDDASLEASVEDPAASTVVGKVGYSVISCPAINPDHCVSGAPWAGHLNANSQKHEAAWLFLQYLTSEEMQEAAAAAGITTQPIRPAVYESPAMADKAPAEYLSAIQYALQHLNGAYKVLVPEEGQLSAALTLALSNIISDQAQPADALAQADATITDVVTKAGYLK